MQARCLGSSFLLMVWLAAGAEAVAQDELRRVGKTFTVVLHPGKWKAELAATLADAALAAAESARPVLEKLQLRPTKLPTIHVYAAESDYRDAEKKHAPQPFLLEAFCRPAAAEAHVGLLPRLDEAVLQRIGLPPIIAETVIEQAAMLAAYERAEWLAKDPWAAKVIACGVVDAVAYPGTKAGVDPGYDTRRNWLVTEARAGRAGKLRDSLSVIPAMDRPHFDAQGEWQVGIAQLLAGSNTGWARKLLANPSPDLKSDAARRAAAIEAVLGKDWNKIEERCAKLLTATTVRWRVGGQHVALRGGSIMMAAADRVAQLMALAPPPTAPYAIRGAATMHSHGLTSLRVQLDESAPEVIVCVFQANKVQIMQVRLGSSDWKELASAAATVPFDRAFEFEVAVGDAVTASIDGVQVVSHPLGQRSLPGAWSILTQESLVLLDGLRCEAVKPAKK